MRCSRTVLATAFSIFWRVGWSGKAAADAATHWVGDEAAFVGDGFEGVRPAGDRDFEVGAAAVPAEFLDEQRAKVEVFQTADDFISVEGRRHREPA